MLGAHSPLSESASQTLFTHIITTHHTLLRFQLKCDQTDTAKNTL